MEHRSSREGLHATGACGSLFAMSLVLMLVAGRQGILPDHTPALFRTHDATDTIVLDFGAIVLPTE